MPSVTDRLRHASRDVGRPLRFDEYLDVVLYGPGGFYQADGRAGRRGDFLTAPEVGPLFGAVVARWIDAEFDRLGRPDGFTVVEAGAGPGTLARAILRVAPQWADRYLAVEISAVQRLAHPDGVRSSAVMPPHGLVGVVIANELLDNVPFRLAVFDGGWREAFVDVDGNGRCTEVLATAPSDWSWLPPHAPHGARVPVQQRAAEWVSDAVAALAAGSLLAFDYCTATTTALAAVPWRQWLRTYRTQARGDHYLRAPGEQDITAQVCLDQLPAPASVRTQAQFLRRWGIDDLVEEGRRTWAASASAPSLQALVMRSRIREAQALLDPAGMGAFHALEWRHAVDDQG